MNRSIVIVFGFMLAACSSNATRVHLEVTADSSWGLDHYQLRISTLAATAEPLPAIDVELPDDMAGHAQAVEVWGLVAGDQVAYGSVIVTPVVHTTVAAAVALSAVSCGLLCNDGETACGSDGMSTTTCIQQSDGCLAWSTPSACPAATPYCNNGACAAQCVDECMSGQTECDTAFAVHTCEQTTGDSCWHWSTSTGCGSGQMCVNGMCGSATTCSQAGASCNDGDPCTVDDTCMNGVCSGTPKCTAPANAQPTCAADGTCGFTCDDGFMKSGSGCVASPKIVFVTHGQWDGDLGGLSGADALCASAASAAGLTGTFVAWLSDDTTSAETRLSHSTTPYVLTTGTVVANDWTDLTSGSLRHAIDCDETGSTQLGSDPGAWTNTRTDGSHGASGENCNEWTSNSCMSSDDCNYGDTGFPNEMDSGWTYPTGGIGCDSTSRLYCFQQ